MKNTRSDHGLSTSRWLARFGGRFLCRSPPAAAAGGRGARMKSLLRRTIRNLLMLIFCLTAAVIILTDPLCAAVLASGFRLRRPRQEKNAVTVVAASTPSKESP